MQITPISNTIIATKKVCTYINCRFIKLKPPSSVFQLKRFGKRKCRKARAIINQPAILRCSSIALKNKSGDEWSDVEIVCQF